MWRARGCPPSVTRALATSAISLDRDASGCDCFDTQAPSRLSSARLA